MGLRKEKRLQECINNRDKELSRVNTSNKQLEADNKRLKEALKKISKRAYKAHCDPKASKHAELYGIANDADQALSGDDRRAGD